MKTNNRTKFDEDILSLEAREAKVKAALAAVKVKKQKWEEALIKREFATVGESLVKYAGQSPDFKLMLKQVLASAVTDEAARKFLAGRGWL
jgi:hypothetical protein